MLVRDILQLILWFILGLSSTWLLFAWYTALRTTPRLTRHRVRKGLSVFVFCFTIPWTGFWVAAIFYNLIQIGSML